MSSCGLENKEEPLLQGAKSAKNAPHRGILNSQISAKTPHRLLNHLCNRTRFAIHPL